MILVVGRNVVTFSTKNAIDKVAVILATVICNQLAVAIVLTITKSTLVGCVALVQLALAVIFACAVYVALIPAVCVIISHMPTPNVFYIISHTILACNRQTKLLEKVAKPLQQKSPASRQGF